MLPLTSANLFENSCISLFVVSLASSSPSLYLPLKNPITINAPVTAPQVCCIRPIPPPKPEAMRKATSSSTFKISANDAITDCEQLNPPK